MIDRRKLIALLGGAILAWPPAVRGQEPGRTYRIGALQNMPSDAPNSIAFYDALSRLGFVEGQNLQRDGQGYGLRPEQFAQHAAELVKAKVDVILASGDAAIRAAQQATATISILGFTEDMVGSGLVSSMAHPGGNTTGISILGTELDGKRQEILIEMTPGIRRIAALADSNTTAPRQLQALQDAARAQAVELSLHQVAEPEEIVGAMVAAQAEGAAALTLLGSPLFFAQRRLIIERAAALRLPAIYNVPEIAEDGGLAAYGPRIVQLVRDVYSRQLVALLRGTKPADLPVEQPTRFELVINLKTAKALGLAIPQSILALADKVIE